MCFFAKLYAHAVWERWIYCFEICHSLFSWAGCSTFAQSGKRHLSLMTWTCVRIFLIFIKIVMEHQKLATLSCFGRRERGEERERRGERGERRERGEEREGRGEIFSKLFQFLCWVLNYYYNVSITTTKIETAITYFINASPKWK